MLDGLNVPRVLGGLKDFQRRTVDYVFHRMWDDPPATRFLVADEVGLGKTLVARGVIARTLDHLQHTVDRLDVVYVCSNSAIARQNINKLNVLGDHGFSYASRLTLLPLELRDLERNRVNFISFTPGTTFNLRSSGGVKEERALLFRILTGTGIGRPTPVLNAFQCAAGRDSFRRLARDRSRPLSENLAAKFVDELRRHPALLGRVEELCDRFPRARERWPDEHSSFRYHVIGELRELLAHVCVDALEPDLVILDEFQRFKDLLGRDTEAGELAHSLMSHVTPEGNKVRVLLLSATPYRTYTMHHEQDEDHYRDFLDTARFLLDDDVAVERLDRDLRDLRSALYSVGDDEASFDRLASVQAAVQERLLSVMVRTERAGRTDDLNGMLRSKIVEAPVARADLEQARLVDGVAAAVGAGDVIEYWKSAPYLLHFMKDYQLKRKLDEQRAQPNPALAATIRAHEDRLLRRARVDEYRKIEPDNGRLRALVSDMIDSGGWRVLWIPPALPYIEPSGAFAEVRDLTKALVFSSWNVVPDAIAALCSYEVTRRIMSSDPDRPLYHDLVTKRRGLLRYSRTPEGEPRNMTTLAALYPSPALADAVDPLAWAAEAGGPVPLPEVRARAAAAIDARLRAASPWPPPRRAGLPDPRWYWVALALLDRASGAELVDWCRREWTRIGQSASAPPYGSPEHDGRSASAGHDDGLGFPAHVDRFAEALVSFDLAMLELGDPPGDVIDALVDLALGSPAVCALRALRRTAGDDTPRAALWTAAARIAEAFRTMFNIPESMALLRATDDVVYWRAVLHHGIEGNLQAVLDEYAHVLAEWLGLRGHPPAKLVAGIAAAIEEALSLQSGRVEPDEIDVTDDHRVMLERFTLRCRYALRFTELKDDSGSLARVDTVRKAFNSPFRPFILATTSVGQEGLDFHPYCHAVYHWNLPSSPVDMEQREGRVHRYKGHAVRKNIARRFGLECVGMGKNGRTADPWQILFDHAHARKQHGQNDLYPFWLFPIEDGAHIERRVPILPLSRERGRYERLRRSLAVYRMVFGQPRQEDLLAHLQQRLTDEQRLERLARQQIRLEPPEEVIAVR